MGIIATAVHSTEENKRQALTERTLASLWKTVDFSRHRLVVVDNASCEEMRQSLLQSQMSFNMNAGLDVMIIITNAENLGTARAINQAWKLRKPGEVAVKIDDDVEIHHVGWLDEMEEALRRDPAIGIVGLKRNDLAECPWSTVPHYKSRLRMLPHNQGQTWVVVEEVAHVMGTCQAYSPALLDKIGYLYQMQDMGVQYAFDDSIASFRAKLAGFKLVFLPHIRIDHIDPGGGSFCEWKRAQAEKWMPLYNKVCEEYRSGSRSLYWEDK